MVHGQVVRGPVVNHVLLPYVVSPISQPAIGLVPRISVEIVHLVVDSGRHGIVKRLVVDVILVTAARIVMILAARRGPVILVLVRALINTNHGRVIRFSRPFRRLENGRVKCQWTMTLSRIPVFVVRFGNERGESKREKENVPRGERERDTIILPRLYI